MVGDVDHESVWDKASMVTPVYGGVGSITTAILMENTVNLYEIQKNNPKKKTFLSGMKSMSYRFWPNFFRYKT